ncbi:MAG: transporter substrate-binding domain-containing protein [Candidatus Cloacimonadota bacterium]|nr:transporter substrate-binding domain-containing protein [Candidatus Cloacimonadota bacterium]
MGKSVFFILFIFISFSCWAQIPLEDEELQYLEQNPVIKIANTDYPPFDFTDETMQFHGFTVDLIRWISIQYDFRTQFQKITLAEAKTAVKNRELHFISNFFYSEERNIIYDFTDPICKISASIFIPIERTDIQTLQHLQEKRIVLQKGDYAVDFLYQKGLDFRALFAEDFSEAVDLMNKEKADALIGDEPVIFYHLFQKGLSNKFKKIGEPLYIADNCLGSWKGNSVLISIFNKGIASAKESGFYEKLQHKWLGTAITSEDNFLTNNWEYIVTAFIVLLFILVIFFIMNKRLTREVHRRTKEIIKTNSFLKNEIAERKQAQESLNQSLKLLNALVEQSPVGISVRDKTGTLLLANKAWQSIWGISDKDLKNKFKRKQSLCLDNTDEYLGKYKDKIKEIYEKGGKLHIPEINLTNNPKTNAQWISQRFYSIIDKNNKVDSVVILTEDITKSKKNELRIKESEERYRILYQEIRDAIILENEKEEILSANAAACELFDYPYEQLITKHSYEFQPKDIQAKKIRKIYSSSFSDLSETFETEILTRKGERIAVEVTTGSFQTATGEKRILSVLHNIEDRKRREQQLKKANAELHKIKENLQKQVDAAVKGLRKKDHLLIKQSRNAAMGEMISNIAHQWRQPLSAVAAIVQDIEDAYEYGELDEKYLQTSVEKTMDQISYMSRTIDDFRNFFRPNKERKLFSIQKILENTINFVDKSFQAHNIKIELIVKKDSKVFGFPNEYSQVILNILNNAKDAFLEQNIKNGKVEIVCDVTSDDKSIVTIYDNADGIPEDILGRIFDPYFTTKEQDKGTGIGLYMAKMIIEENMGGTLCAENLEQGACFRIVL